MTESARLHWHRSSWEELPAVWGQGPRPRGATPRWRSKAASKTSYRRPEVRGGGRGGCAGKEGQEELLHIQGQEGQLWGDTPRPRGKEQKLRFTGAALKRYPTSKVRETQVRWQVSQEASEGRHTNHNHRKLINLKTRTTALSNSETKPYRVWPPKTGGSWWRGLTECGPLEKGMANHFSILALRTPWTVWKDEMIGY